MSSGPSCEAPVTLLKTCTARLTIWTYCVAPTSPSVSGGAQLHPTPGNGMPVKFRMGGGMTAGARLPWTTVIATIAHGPVKAFRLEHHVPGIEGDGGTGMSRSGGETSCLTS
jgi:hypothetical protein